MGFYAKIFQYRRLAFILVALAAGHLLLVVAAVFLVVRYLQLWAIPAVLWLPLTIVPFRVTTGWLRQVYDARVMDVVASSGLQVMQPAPGSRESSMLDNIVEELAVASGGARPDAKVCESQARNAFISPAGDDKAAGPVVAFTTGMTAALNRQELQAVAASLYAHLGNLDRLLVSMAGAMYFSVFAAADAFLVLNTLNWHFGGSSDFSTGPLVVILTLGMLAGPIVAARTAQTLVIRRTRYLDDAEGVELVKDPGSLIGALRLTAGSRQRLDAKYDLASVQFFFDAPVDRSKRFSAQLVPTHPSADARAAAVAAVSGAPVEGR